MTACPLRAELENHQCRHIVKTSSNRDRNRVGEPRRTGPSRSVIPGNRTQPAARHCMNISQILTTATKIPADTATRRPPGRRPPSTRRSQAIRHRLVRPSAESAAISFTSPAPMPPRRKTEKTTTLRRATRAQRAPNPLNAVADEPEHQRTRRRRRVSARSGCVACARRRRWRPTRRLSRRLQRCREETIIKIDPASRPASRRGRIPQTGCSRRRIEPRLYVFSMSPSSASARDNRRSR